MRSFSSLLTIHLIHGKTITIVITVARHGTIYKKEMWIRYSIDKEGWRTFSIVLKQPLSSFYKDLFLSLSHPLSFPIPSLTFIALNIILGIEIGRYCLIIIVIAVPAAIATHVFVPWWWSIVDRWTCRWAWSWYVASSIMLRWIGSICIVWTWLTMSIIAVCRSRSIGGRCWAGIKGSRWRGTWIIGSIATIFRSRRITRSLCWCRTQCGGRITFWRAIAITIAIAQTEDGAWRTMWRRSYSIIVHAPIRGPVTLIHFGYIGGIATRYIGIIVGRRIIVLVERGIFVQWINLVWEIQTISHTGHPSGTCWWWQRWGLWPVWWMHRMWRGIYNQHRRIAHIQWSIGQIHWGYARADRTRRPVERIVAQIEAIRFARIQIEVGIENDATWSSAAVRSTAGIAILLRRQLTCAVSASMHTAIKQKREADRERETERWETKQTENKRETQLLLGNRESELQLPP